MAKETTDIQKKEAQSVDTVERTRASKVFVPAVDIVETDKDIQVFADMPGVDKNSIDITLEQDVLTIMGNAEAFSPQGYDLTYAEYEFGDYQRSFTLTENVDQEKIEAKYNDGVLELKLPKAEPVKPKKITIKAN
jgi:HSP20 family molecular chaperone IbpA